MADNIGYALKIAGLSKAERMEKVRKVAALLGLTEFLDRKPGQLSGGQRQRVAMGRAMIREPKVFLYDEPLSNLDARLRVAMRVEIRKLHQRLGTTTLFVTHDQIEAMTLADRIVVMNKGVRRTGRHAGAKSTIGRRRPMSRASSERRGSTCSQARSIPPRAWSRSATASSSPTTGTAGRPSATAR